jgi:LytS/YehU family sensor histidine kinase
VLDYSTTKSITIEEELSFLKLYLSIENQRFQDSIKLVQNLQCDEELKIPPLLIQPLFENAIVYGSRNLDGELNIYFSLVEEADHLKIEVRNELNKDLVKNHSFQSRSTDIIHKRLSLFEGKASFETRIKVSFLIAKILLPISA